ncbi:LITAF-like zinc ribbon domain-containing protein [Neohortaea acidophila]|uniref:LITAF-like zinc ribbon domain-containing protein n=1 Tax=Neohortaea acidophila TaxID=245834 RepID=A0A6A6Q304_9PEZI|nr:LITAF-like zinc ribbon domain-containing protein [Neohortaea acidophila]KAF2486878.1 LITAF-like zinc ribbon domain-containing protein [Neohortaea acidophila]
MTESPPSYQAASGTPQFSAEKNGMQYTSDPSPATREVHSGGQHSKYSQQPQGQHSKYSSATPIHTLGMSSVPVDCPGCGHRALTQTDFQAGKTTHAWAVGLCCLTGVCCWIPYVMNGMKDVQHRCGSCGMLLATWHKSGHVEVHAHA